jgi:hypothetical protein
VFGGFSWERNLTKDCAVSEPGLVVDPNSLRFCDEWNPSYESPTGMVTLDRKPFGLDFRLGASLPVWGGFQVGASLLLNDEGSRAPTYLYGRLATTRYPNGSATYLTAKEVAPACPGACPAGDISFPSYTAATSVSVGLYPGGTVDAERLKQVDLKVSKTFRFGRMTIAPTFEAFNITNQDMVITYASQSYAAASGLDLVPNSVLQGRILGFGANVRW